MLVKSFITKKEKAQIFSLPLNILTKKNETVDMRELKTGTRIFALNAKGRKVHNRVTKVEKLRVKGKFFLINQYTLIYQEQSIFANGRCVHARELKINDELIGEEGKKIKIDSLKIISGEDYFYRLEINGDHAFFLNGILMHNASRFLVLGTCTWDNSDTTHWAATSGGAGGASVPGSGDTVTLDANSGGGTVTPNYDMTVTSITMGAFTGTLDFSANNNSPTLTTFSASGSGVRTLNMGSGLWTITGSGATVFNIATVTNLTFNGGSAVVALTYSGATGTRTVNSNVVIPTLNITAGTDIFSFSQTFANVINFTGFSGTLSGSGAVNFTGNVTLSSGLTQSGTSAWTYSGTSGTANFTSNGKILAGAFTINGVGGTLQLVDDFNSSSSFSLTNGSFLSGDNDVTCSVMSSSNSNTRSMILGSMIFTCTGDGANIWNFSTTTGLTFSAGSSTIKLTSTLGANRNFAGGGLSYNNFWNATTGAFALTITGSNTFTDLKIDAGRTQQFTASTITTVSTFTATGTLGNEITIGSATASNHTLTKAGGGTISCDYLIISRSTVSPSTTWYAGANSTDGGNNSGWSFTVPPIIAAQGSYTLSGQTVSFSRLTNIIAAQGSYTLSGQTVSFSLHYKYSEETLNTNSFTKVPLQANSFSKGGLPANTFTKEPLANT